LAIGFTSCGGHGSQNNPSGPSGSDTALLIQLNARFNDGRTVRWANLPIPVFTNGIAREDEVTGWTWQGLDATGAPVAAAFARIPWLRPGERRSFTSSPFVTTTGVVLTCERIAHVTRLDTIAEPVPLP